MARSENPTPDGFYPGTMAMSAEDFAAFEEIMREEHGWTGRRLATELGCGTNQIKRWRDRGAPRYIAFAAQALVHELGPFTVKKRRLRKPAA
jgi:hypothetical protein